MKNMQQKLPCLESIYVIGKSDDFTTFDTICKTSPDLSFLKEEKRSHSGDIAYLPCSSGTTGQPKSVMLSHKNMVAMLYSYSECLKWREQEGHVFYTDRPMYHGGGFFSVISSLFDGIKLIIKEGFQIDKMLETVKKYKVNYSVSVPAVMIALANFEDAHRYDTSSLVSILCGGAVMSPDIRRSLEEKFNVELIPGYGMSECGNITIGKKAKNDFFSVGTVCPNMEVKIIDLESSEECPDDKNGEVLVRGPQVMKGYLKNPGRTAKTLEKDGWMHTGDIGHFDENGRLYIVDRVNEVIKYKTLQVSPAEVETVLLKHPKIADVGVIGIPDPHDGELPRAFVVKKDESLTEQEVVEFAKSELADKKHLRGGVEFVSSIPTSLAGKIQRKELKRMAGIDV